MLPTSLRNGELRRLLAAQMPADFSDWLDFVAIGTLLAFTWNVPGYVFALLAASMGLPYLVVGPVAGALVDRLQVRSVLIFSNVARGLATATFFLAPDWPVLLCLVAVRSSVDTFFTPAKQAALQALTTPAERTSANGLSHTINQASKIIAPGAGGMFLIFFAPGAIFLLNAGVSLFAALLALRVGRIDRSTEGGDGRSRGLFGEIGDGLREVRTNGIVRAVLLMMATAYFAMFLYDTFIPPLTRDFGFDPVHLGMALAAVGAGGVCGSLALGFVSELRRPNLWIGTGMLVSAAVAAFLGYAAWSGARLESLVFIAMFGVLGLTTAMSVVPFRSILQNTVPEARMGRVTALSEAANTVAMLSAPFAGAVLVSALSIGAPFVCGGIVMLAVAIRAATLKLT